MKHLVSCLAVLILLTACNTPKTIISTLPELEERTMDTIFVEAPAIKKYDKTEPFEPVENTLPVYRKSHMHIIDLLHTRLDLSFDWEKEQVLGMAVLSLKPYFYPTQTLTLDAKNFEFHKVNFEGQNKQLTYEYDGNQVVIDLGRVFTRDEKINLEIKYTATPSASGGSAAITSDKGLYFINSLGEEGKPQQIWTQGETESNSRWFPTVDKPNERCTQEIYLTVDDKFKTLSNGLLESSVKNADGTRTDYWKMDQAHAPYLFMLAIGDYAVVEDKWKNIPLSYYVEHEYEKDAKAIFPHTPEMLTFFSDKFGMDYPWAKYAQVVVRDYVSGAMENTTAVIFGEFVQKHERELIDDTSNEGIVAHEMSHHWFGDLVTCESWANTAMNEGFANYSEYLWLEHKYGRDAADYHLLREWNGYLGSATMGVHPLIDFEYDDKENMFDQHSYNKGGSILHMLRNHLGDDAFFAGLKKYLEDNAYTAVEAHDLRLAMEAVSGRDLNWFFNQWYFEEGHPRLKINYRYDELEKLLVVKVEQRQTLEETPAIFRLPVFIDVYQESGVVKREQIEVNQREQTFYFFSEKKPRLAIFDADRALLAEIEDNKSAEEYFFQFSNAPKFLDRFEALQYFDYNDHPAVEEIHYLALKDPFWAVRRKAAEAIFEPSEKAALQLRKMAKEDPHSEVRVAALSKLVSWEDEKAVEIAKVAIENDRAYPVIGEAMGVITKLEKESAPLYAQKLEKETNPEILIALSEIYLESEDASHLPFFVDKMEYVSGYSAFTFTENYMGLAYLSGLEPAMDCVKTLKAIATDMGQSPWKRFASAKAINDLQEFYQKDVLMAKKDSEKEVLSKVTDELSQILDAIKAAETHEDLLQYYRQF